MLVVTVVGGIPQKASAAACSIMMAPVPIVKPVAAWLRMDVLL
jgi:hypothetical protein